MIEKSNWMFFTEWASIIAVFITCFMFLHNQINNLDHKLERQGERTDKLYEMWCETQKEIKQLYIDMNKEKR